MALWRDLFVETPPGNEIEIADATASEVTSPETGPVFEKLSLDLPDIELHCGVCGGLRNFRTNAGRIAVIQKTWSEHFLLYQYLNCGQDKREEKLFAIRINPGLYKTARAIKIGEWPPFGPHISSQTISLIGPDRELFLKGRRAESQGLGIGAYAYYRQVVENQKDRILEKIAQVAEKVKASPEVIERIRNAKQVYQFSKAIEEIQEVIPDILKSDGENLLLPLHKALSKGLHNWTDDQCLRLATDIRTVLNELADQLHHVLKDKSQLQAALGRISNI